MILLVTGQYHSTRSGRSAACALALVLASGAALAQSPPQSPPQSPLHATPATWQSPPSLTLPAATPLPQRARQAATENVPLEKVTLDASALFEFDEHALRPGGRAELDDFVARLKGASLGMIRAVGHADRLGSEAYNQILSEDRADAVKAYLVSKGIEAGRVSTEGRGATQPATKPGECAGARSGKVIACLQPDRRVGIEAAGTRPSTYSGTGPAFDRN